MAEAGARDERASDSNAFELLPWGNGMEFAPLGVLGGAFLAMPVPVRNPSSIDRAVLNREVGRDAVSQVFQDTIAAVWIQTSIRVAPSAGSCSWNRAVHFERAAARSIFVC